jgi:SAM-dependent methyltransferase
MNDSGVPVISDFYADAVHCHILENHEAALEKYRKRMRRELTWMGIEPRQLRGLTCLDVGTGYQAIILAELGCRRVFHRDISNHQVQWLQSYCRTHRIKAIHSEQADLMEPWEVAKPLDLSLMIGVYHHLPESPRLLRSLWEHTREGGMIFLRCYRSGTWSRWLTAHLRTLSCYCTPERLLAEYRQQFAGENDRQFLGDMLDDLFVPVWKCFHPRQFRNDAKLLGMAVRTEEGEFDLDIEAHDENFRVLMRKDGARCLPPLDFFSTGEPIDQLALDLSAYPKLKQAAQRFHALETRAGSMEQGQLANKLLVLYRLVRPGRTGGAPVTMAEKLDALLGALRHCCGEAGRDTLTENRCIS